MTGFPLKEKGSVPANLAYLESPKIADISNMIDYIMTEYGYDRTQAYMIASVAVELQIAQLFYVSNVRVTAILPLDVFVGRE